VQRAALYSLFFPIYYMTASWVVTLRLWRKKRQRRAKPHPPLAV
jgi:hypothetical protein